MKSADLCLVCGETNSTVGWHCGTITCEACKKFFQRNNEVDDKDKDQKCVRGTNNCAITVATRTNCTFCRFQKCLQVGMKSNGELDRIPNHSVEFKQVPCRVCGDASSGVHFGEITCEGCKGFFRRNANEISKFVCVLNSKCEISVPNRNSCKACRLNKCFQIGMSLKKSKIGRQSNLFKEKLKHEVNLSKGGHAHLTSGQIKSDLIRPQSIFFNNSNLNIEEKLDQSTCSFIKSIYDSYVKAFETSTVQFFQYDETYLEHFKEHNIVCNFLTSHMNRCITFLEEIPVFQALDKRKKIVLIANGMHLIRLLQISNNLSIVNYFDFDAKTYETVTDRFPVFKEKAAYFDSYRQHIQTFKLDPKELALYSALLIFSGVGQEYSKMQECYGINMEICRALTAYMQARRSETETAEMLVQNSYRFERLNTHLQLGIFNKFEELEKYGFSPTTLCHILIYIPFRNIINNINLNVLNI